MRFSNYSLSADQALAKFIQHTSHDNDPSARLFREKLALCDYRVLLVTQEQPLAEHLNTGEYDPQILAALYQAWQAVGKSRSDLFAQKRAWRIINQIGEVIKISGGKKSGPALRRFRNNLTHDRFFLLLTGHEPEGLPTYELLALCNLWQLEQGYLPVHAAGIIHKNRLFLFTGRSGAGKSTIAQMSLDENCAVLDEDQVLVHRLDEARYTADAWGYNVQTCDIPLRAFFNLIQDPENRIIPLTPSRVTRLLLERNSEILGDMLSEEMLISVFQQAAAIARIVPGFELHFRKSPTFWKVIDERFPD